MRGETNSAPTGGGLKVIAIGSRTNGSVTFPQPAKVVFVNLIAGSCVVLPKDRKTQVIQDGGKIGDCTLSEDGMTIQFANGSSTFYYLALG